MLQITRRLIRNGDLFIKRNNGFTPAPQWGFAGTRSELCAPALQKSRHGFRLLTDRAT